MAIPSRDKIKEALLIFLEESALKGESVTPEKAYEALAQDFNLTEDDLKLRRPSGEETWPNEVRQVRRELVDEELISPPEVGGHGVWKLTQKIEKIEAGDTPELIATYSSVKYDGFFDPASVTDAREIILRAIVQRRGQYDFRAGLLKAYEFKCAITSEPFIGVLEAAHIVPYQGTATNVISNGLLFRADIHTLFDLFLLSVNPSTHRVGISQTLQDTGYAKYHDRPIFLPRDAKNHPSSSALQDHWNKCKL